MGNYKVQSKCIAQIQNKQLAFRLIRRFSAGADLLLQVSVLYWSWNSILRTLLSSVALKSDVCFPSPCSSHNKLIEKGFRVNYMTLFIDSVGCGIDRDVHYIHHCPVSFAARGSFLGKRLRPTLSKLKMAQSKASV